MLFSASNTIRDQGREFSESSSPGSIGQHVRASRDVRASPIEILPYEILFSILGELSGNDLIILSLSSKTLALAIYRGGFEMYNNTYFSLRTVYPSRARCPCHCPATPSNPSRNMFTRSCDGRWECPRNCCYLLERVEQWLGDEYGFCQVCYKFRIKRTGWWTTFAEYSKFAMFPFPSNHCFLGSFRCISCQVSSVVF